MSSAKFSAITADLLARKGEATPSLATLPPRTSVFEDEIPPFSSMHADADVEQCTQPQAPPRATASRASRRKAPDKVRRLVITLTLEEFERLGIAAIKMDTTRHQIVRDALDAHIHQLADELPRPCRCMTDGGCCS